MTLGTNRRRFLIMTYILSKTISLELFHASYHINLYWTVRLSEVVEFIGLLTACEQDQDPARKLSANLYDI
jgi:hypothetical protein